jgi:biopolymer transport protein TolQ
MDWVSLGDWAQSLVQVAASFADPGAFVQAAPLDPAPEGAPITDVVTQAVAAPAGKEPIDMSIIGLINKADIVVKGVMALLVILSLWSWAIIFDKWIKLGRANREADRFESTFWSGKSLDDLHAQLTQKGDAHPMAQVFSAAMQEWRRSFQAGTVSTGLLPSVKDRINRVMNVTIQKETAALENRLGFLASVGSNAVFIGLFGTVWGIMNSFMQIGVTQSTSLAVVAPGIAEALLATGIGLVAAIPAATAYNHFSDSAGRFAGRLETFSDEFMAILSRQLDERAR